MSGVWALVPVKSFDKAKVRLTGVLTPAERSQLAKSLLAHVVDTLRQTQGLAGIAVVAEGYDVLAYAESLGVTAFLQEPSSHLGAVVDGAFARLAKKGATSALVVMSDLPLAQPVSFEALLKRMNGCDWLVVPDETFEGTNVLGVSLPSKVPTCFGRHGSFGQHLARAKEHALRCDVAEDARLAFDVDTPEDYARIP